MRLELIQYQFRLNPRRCRKVFPVNSLDANPKAPATLALQAQNNIYDERNLKYDISYEYTVFRISEYLVH